MDRPRTVLIKPPENSEHDFGAFSLGVLAAYVRDITDIVIMDATDSQPSDAVEYVWSLKPHIVGITVMGLGSVQSSILFLRLLLRHAMARAAIVLVGGHGATWAPEIFLEAGATAVVIGEGELALRSVIERGVEPGAPGIACFSGGKLISGQATRLITPLDQLPSPARSLMPSPRNGIHLMETSRGCPHRCAFCETSRFYGTKWRPFSPQRVASEVGSMVDDYDAWMILFADDNFSADPARVIDICERLRKGPLPAFFLASVRADDLLRDPRVIPEMAKARILRVTIGVETLELEVAKAIGKSIQSEMYREAFMKLRANGIFSVASFITGLPGQRVDVSYVVEQAVKAGPDAAVFVPFIPMPGTPLAEGISGVEPNTVDKRKALEMTKAFSQHPEIRRRLAEAEESGGVRGLMARAAASHHKRAEQNPPNFL